MDLMGFMEGMGQRNCEGTMLLELCLDIKKLCSSNTRGKD